MKWREEWKGGKDGEEGMVNRMGNGRRRGEAKRKRWNEKGMEEREEREKGEEGEVE